MEEIISQATRQNWNRLKTNSSGRLTSRANKRLSKEKRIPLEYFSYSKENMSVILDILSKIEDNNNCIGDVIYSLGYNLLDKKQILNKQHVQNVLKEYDYILLPWCLTAELPNNEYDLLGLIYQSYLTEGSKNKAGSYYTPERITSNMVSGLDFSKGQLFLDPCCGSGAFILALKDAPPEQIYGIDIDSIAVMIAKINLLLKYPYKSFAPNIVQADYIASNNLQNTFIEDKEFDYIVTNPPWGAMNDIDTASYDITSGETFSYFFVKAYNQLKNAGDISFLLPEAVLNVKVHKDIREFILKNCSLNKIVLHKNEFTGVTTKYVEIHARKSADRNTITVVSRDETKNIKIDAFYQTENYCFSFFDDIDVEIINAVKRAGYYTLKDSIWALGIVTGNNKDKLLSKRERGAEEIYTGKEIAAYNLLPVQKYIHYDRSQFQQVAKEEYYRADEKLVYKFITNKLVFAYDNQKRLFLNSANIIIPNIPNMSIKTVLAFLNSDLFQYYYSHAFGEIKVLKGNLSEIPFPLISTEQNARIESMVDRVLCGENGYIDLLQDEVYLSYNLTEEHIKHIKKIIYGTIG